MGAASLIGRLATGWMLDRLNREPGAAGHGRRKRKKPVGSLRANGLQKYSRQ
jgi:hypothetical protein